RLFPHLPSSTSTLIIHSKKFRENSANSATEGIRGKVPCRFRANQNPYNSLYQTTQTLALKRTSGSALEDKWIAEGWIIF
ncbi:MAG: hypothetical protein K2M88_01025, partial [Muribaculaceae bacterium]|nr:hypothetical protein [Muribaculaceae bacterium]